MADTFQGLGRPIIQRPTAKTADYGLTQADIGGIFTNRGAGGAVNFTLPAPAAALNGAYYDFFVVADQSVTLTAPSGKLVVFNNAAATSAALSTSSQRSAATSGRSATARRGSSPAGRP